MSDLAIFLFGTVVSILVLLGTYVFTVYEFHQMAKHPEKYRIDNDEEESEGKIRVVESA